MGTNLQGYHLLWPDLPTFSQLQFTARVGAAQSRMLARVGAARRLLLKNVIG